MADIVRHADGVYLNLRHAEYLADDALGYGAINALAVNPVEFYWTSPWNPLRPPEPANPAFERGEAAHVAFLDGLAKYNRLYGRIPTKATHPDHLDGVRELIEACAKHGLPTSGLRGELIDRLRRAKPKGVKLLEVARERFARTGKKSISEADDAAIRMAHRMAFRSRQELNLPDGEHVTLKDAFRGGLHEVSVFWTDADGIRQRARFDKIKPMVTIDVKSLTEWRPSDFKKSLLREIMQRRYIGQAPHYDVGREELRRAVADGRVFGGTPVQRKRLDLIAESDVWGWAFVFVKLDGAPQSRAVIIDRTGPQYARAAEKRMEALTLFAFYRETFGLDTPWFESEVVWTPSDTDWPEWSVLND